MKKKLLIVVTLFLISVVFQGGLVTLYRSRHQDEQFTTLVQNVSFSSEVTHRRLLSGDKISQSFIADHDNLGTISILFNNHNRINDDWVIFRVREAGSNDWHYENKYKSDQFYPNVKFPFGFPVIDKSRNREFFIEIESIGGSENNSISINGEMGGFNAIYSFPRSYLQANPNEIPVFFISRLKMYLSHIAFLEFCIILGVSLVFLMLLTIKVFKPKRITQYLQQLQDNSKFETVLIPFIIFLLTLLISGYFSTLEVDPHHDGILLKPAFDLINGKILFKDTFTQYGALTTIIQAQALKIFGSYLITIKLLTAFFYALISVLLYLIYRKIMPQAVLFTSLIIWLLMAPYYSSIFLPWSSVYALFFQLASLYIFGRCLENYSTKKLLLASVFSSLVFWCKQTVGVFTILGLLSSFIYLFVNKIITRKTFIKLGVYLLGVNLIVGLLFILYFLSNQSLVDWYKQSMQLAFLWGRIFGGGFNPLKILKALFPTSLSPVSVWVLIPISAILMQISDHKNKLISLIVFLGLASWLQYYPLSDPRHSYWAVTPIFPLFALFILKICQKFIFVRFKLSRKTVNHLAILLLSLVFFYDISGRLGKGFSKLMGDYTHVNQPTILKGMRLPIRNAEFYNYLSKSISDYFIMHPKGNVVTNGPNALYLTFDSRIKNIQPIYVNWTWLDDSIYPDYYKIINGSYKNNSLLISYEGQLPEGYCFIDDRVNSDSIALSLPCN